MSVNEYEKEERLSFTGKLEDWDTFKAKFIPRAAAKGYMKALLSNNGVPEESKTTLTADEKENQTMNFKAYSALTMACKGAAFGVVVGAKTSELPTGDASLAWKKLNDKYQPKTKMSATQLLKRFQECSLKDTSTDPDEWIQELNLIRSLLEATKSGEKISDDRLLIHIMANMPDGYSEVITTVEGRLDDTTNPLTLEQLEQQLRSFYKRKFSSEAKTDEVALFAGGFKGTCRICGKIGHKARDCPDRNKNNNGKGNEKGGTEPGSGWSKKKFNGRCFKCGERGHRKSDCPELKKNKNSSGSGNNEEGADLVLVTLEVAMTATTSNPKENTDLALRVAARGKDFFVCDSGASSHMTNDKARLHDVETISKTIRVGNGESVKSTMKGKMKTTLVDTEGNKIPTVIQDVIYVPKLMCNLLSVGQLTKKGGEVVYDNSGAKMKAGGRVFAFDNVEGSTVFGLDLTSGEESALTTLPEGGTVTFTKAHGFLGHPGMDVTRSTMNHWGFSVKGKADYCEACVRAKAKQKNIKKTTHTLATTKCERLYIDISSVSQASGGGKRHWAMVVDDFTRMKWCRFLKQKSDLKDFVVPLVQNMKEKGHKVKFVRLDNAGENQVLVGRLKTLGVEPEWTAPDSPQQNGVVERAFATLASRGRAMMIAAGMTDEQRYKFWAEAFNTATTLSNINPFRRNGEEKGLSPFQRFYGEDKKPKWIHHMHTFGEIGQKPTRETIRSKLADRSERVMFLGYAEDHPGDCYRVYKFEKDSVVLSRDTRWSGLLHRGGSSTSDVVEEGGNPDGSGNPEGPNGSKSDSESGDGNRGDKSKSSDGESIANETVDDGFGNGSGEEWSDAEGVHSDVVDEDHGWDIETGTPSPRRSGLRKRTGVPLKELLEIRAKSRNLEDVEIALIGAVDSGPAEPKTFREARQSEDYRKWNEAMKTEYENMKEKNVWIPWDEDKMKKGVSILGTKWVFKIKPDGRYRARLVVKGYNQIPGVDFTESHAPVASDATIRCMLVESVMHGWDIDQIDVETAFLYGDLEEEVYLSKPEGFDELSDMHIGKGQVLRMNKAGYGLVQASRAWIKTWTAFLMEELGFDRSMADPCLLTKRNNKGLEMMVVVYVDDCIVAGPTEKVCWFNRSVKKRFNIKEMGALSEYVGAEYERTGKGFMMRQWRLIDSLKKEFDVGVKTYKTPAAPGKGLIKAKSDEEKVGATATTTYRSGVGKLLYLAKLTRPDMASAVREMAKFLDGTTEEHMKAMYRGMDYVIATRDLQLRLEPSDVEKGEIVAYSDSNWASDKDSRKSVSGNVIYYSGALVSWKSKAQHCVTLSSCEAEYMALSQCICDVEYVRQVLESMGVKVKLPMTVFVDNTGAIEMAKNWSTGTRTKHIDIRHHHIREMVEQGMVSIEFVKSEENESDPFTKNVSEKLFEKHREKHGLVDRNKEGVNGNGLVTGNPGRE